MSKKILALWSGGFDSTYMIWNALNQGHEVTSVYVNIVNNKVKTNAELMAISQLEPKLKKYGNFTHFGIGVEIDILYNGNTELNMKQIPLWLTSLLYVTRKEVDEINIGYVIGDHAISYLADIENVWKHFAQFCSPPSLPIIKFPLSKTLKEDIHYYLPVDISKNCWCCESPKEVISPSKVDVSHCKMCPPCVKLLKSGFSRKNLFKYSVQTPIPFVDIPV